MKRQLFAFAVTMTLLTAHGMSPSWWTNRGVVTPQTPRDDFAAVNVGQVKHMAKMACEEMNARFPEGAGNVVNDMIAQFSENLPERNDFAGANVGQIKSVAKPFYDRLIELGQASAYPWGANNASSDDYALANVGQLKHLFSFLVAPDDIDGDRLPDEWEAAQWGGLSESAAADFDEDGLSNEEEYWLNLNPAAVDPIEGAELDGLSLSVYTILEEA